MSNGTHTRARGAALRALMLASACVMASPVAGASPAATLVGDGETLVMVAGIVHDKDGRPLPGASVTIGGLSTTTDADGHWSVSLAPGPHELVVGLRGFETARRDLRVATGLGPVEVALVPSFRLRENVVVQAVRADERTPVTKTDIDHEQIETLNRGQEMPFLLGTSPGVTFQADAGNAAGYTYFNIRGISQTRLNITLDGVPLQDPEDQALYFSDFGDFASVVDSIQIERGVGTSSVGSASYGGSVNFASVNPSERPGLVAEVGGGSWGSARGTVALNSGRLGSFALYGRASVQTTDGFREHSGVDQHTFFFGATRQDERSLFKLFSFVGDERTQLAYLAADEASLKADLRTNPLTPQENDHFGMDVVHAQYTRLMGSATTLMAQAYYNGSRGWFNIWDATQTNLQRYGLDGYLVGLVLGARHHEGRLGLNWGAHVNDFSRDHFMDVVGGSRAYLNTGVKNEYNTFLKATWDMGRAQLWADGQVRHARFEYRGDIPLGSVSWTFFNPKGGIRFDPSPSLGLYASIGRMSREPARSDMLNGEDNASVQYDLTAVKPERVVDGEGGIEWHRGGLVARADVYAMEFADEIALTGELSEIGLPVRRNAGRSHRRGVELNVTWAPSGQWRIGGNASLSRNWIEAWTQYYDVYDTAGNWLESVPLVHHDVRPLLTPAVILNGTLDWAPSREVAVGVTGRFVDAAQLDNTGNPGFRTPSYFDLDGQATIGLRRLVRRGDPRIRIQVTNLLDDRRIWPAGYSYLFFTRDAGGRDTLSGTADYYPLATRSVYVTLDLRF